MDIIRGLHNVRPEHRGCVATIGNFDGVHRGHVAVLDALGAQAKQQQLPALVIVFEPQPLEYIQPKQAPVRLTRLTTKLHLLQQQQVDRVLVIRFDHKFAAQSAEQFVQQILVEQLGVRHIYVGDDFRFGRDRQGDMGLLRQIGKTQGFGVEQIGTLLAGTERISSTRIRAALAAGDMPQARHCLGRDYAMVGRVQRGDQRGRTWGFPTLNLPLIEQHSPLRGVYLVKVIGPGGPWAGVANLGWRPTVAAGLRLLLEVHLLDVSCDLYGVRVQVQFQQRIRDEQKFANFMELQAQIGRDVQQARSLLKMDAEKS